MIPPFIDVRRPHKCVRWLAVPCNLCHHEAILNADQMIFRRGIDAVGYTPTSQKNDPEPECRRGLVNTKGRDLRWWCKWQSPPRPTRGPSLTFAAASGRKAVRHNQCGARVNLKKCGLRRGIISHQVCPFGLTSGQRMLMIGEFAARQAADAGHVFGWCPQRDGQIGTITAIVGATAADRGTKTG
jgi:hypothetical protein